MNFIEYSVGTNLILFRDLEIKINVPEIEKTFIKSIDRSSNYSISFEFNNSVGSIEKMRHIAEQSLNEILNIFCIEHRTQIRGYQEKDVIWNGEKQSSILMGYFLKEADFPKTNEEIEKLIQKIERNSSDYQNIYVQLYRNAMNENDEISRFMLLYSILLQLKGPTQLKVDEYLISKGHDIMRNSTKIDVKNNKKETLITWLRNAIGHTSINYVQDWEKTLFEVSENIIELEKITGHAIKEYVNLSNEI